MNEYLPFIVAGLTTGAVYGLAGVGLVLTYKTSGIFNFAHGALATVSAFAFYSLTVDLDLPWLPSALLCVLLLGPAMGIALERLASGLTGASLALQVAGTVGVLLAIQSAVVLLYDQQVTRTVEPFLGSGSVTISDTVVKTSDIVTFTIALVATAALSVAFRVTRRGLAMRAVVDGAELLDVAGTPPTATRRMAWMIGCSFAAASGVLLSPVLSLDPLQLTLLVVQAFGAAAIGRFTNLPLTFVGGLIVGVVASLATKWFTSGLLSGVPPATPFIVLFAVLLVTPKRFLPTRPTPMVKRGAAWSTPMTVQVPAGLVLCVVLFFVPEFAGTHLTAWTVALAATLIFLSLGLLTRTSGQVSLCHVSFSAIGACAFSQLAVSQGIPWLPALLLTGLVAVPIGALLAVPAIRLGGIYLALATFGFGVLLQFMFYTQEYMFGETGLGIPMPRPSGFETDAAFFRLVLLFVAGATVAMVALDRSRLGRLLRGISDSPLALTTNGVTVNVTRVLVFCGSAFLASIAGALIGAAQTTVSAEAYPPLLSLTYFALIVIVVGKEPWYALIAAGGLLVVPSYVTSASATTWLTLLFGLAAVGLALNGRVPEVPPAVRGIFDRLRRQTVHDRPRAPAPPRRSTGAIELRMEDVLVRFGGHTAVDQLSLTACTGRITALIGPNGAGKTTSFNVLSGLQRATAGAVYVSDLDMTRRSASARARAGLGRTFQQMELLDSMSVRENVAIGWEGHVAGGNPWRHVFGRRGESAQRAQATADALNLCGLEAVADRPVGELSTGQRRLVELARCLAGPSRILLLDEPSSGLDVPETERFGRILKEVVRQRGVGVLLVEHDMSLVLGISDRIYVLDFGELIFVGSPAEVRSSDAVRAAYLGDPEVEDAVETRDLAAADAEAGR